MQSYFKFPKQNKQSLQDSHFYVNEFPKVSLVEIKFA